MTWLTLKANYRPGFPQLSPRRATPFDEPVFSGDTDHTVLGWRSANREIEAERGRMALADLADFLLRRYPHDFLLPRVWELRNNLIAYDAIYVALAEVLDAPLPTHDKRLATAPGHHARIELV